MQIVDLRKQNNAILEQAAILLVEHFDEPSGWPDLPDARESVDEVLEDGFAFGVLAGETLLGWIGGLPEYDGRVWELHPLIVRREYRQLGLGRTLVEAFENEAARRGGLTATLGTDDNTGMTSLAGVDLYQDLPRHLAEMRDLGRRHPFLFYQKLGYRITGVMPDANGRGLPDILMSKPICANASDLPGINQ